MKMITTIRDKGSIYNNCDILDQKQKYKTNNVGLNNINHAAKMSQDIDWFAWRQENLCE
jgi:hypothetical protein